tara:strand:+ start:153 stop:326 length:174 start_codon:yes stop_codon:yes gene_type:complete
MKDKDNVLRMLDDIDNMIMIMNQSVEKRLPIDPIDARTRFSQIRQKISIITDRVTGS